MKNLGSILSEFLEPARPLVFGEPPQSAAVRPVDTDRLIERLDRQVRFNNHLILSVVGVYILLLVVSSALVIVHHDDTKWIITFLGGNFLVLAGIGAKLQDTWREKNYIDMMLAVLPTLTPVEAVKVLQSFYLEKVQKRREKGAAPAARKGDASSR